ncbi:hypothetical protein CLOM_g4623 [Closterium sp. NIES-68]|nr:hypothetical protein CLOM_g4623 [Closterium sp. NIES-68]GJP85747.1 hypothetical protein CLOP_g15848 [Closterium sp. NIES-67]
MAASANPPVLDITIDPASPLEAKETAVRTIAHRLMPAWQQLPETALRVSTISGGITNLIFKVQQAKDEQNKREEQNGEASKTSGDSAQSEAITVRIYGPDTDKIINRSREWEVLMALATANFGPRLIGGFTNGTVQTYLPGRTLTPPEMCAPPLAHLIAAQLHRLHHLEVPLGSDEERSEGHLWHALLGMLETAEKLHFDDKKLQTRFDSIDFAKLRREIREAKELTDRLHSPIVFAHNDLLAYNLLLDDSQPGPPVMHMIDFEYAAYNPRGYDIANHFCEYAGFECEYSRFPSKAHQLDFFRHYLHPGEPNKASQAELDRLYLEVNAFTLASHFFWCLWSLIQAKFSSIDFDYMDYFFVRYGVYQQRKDETVAIVESYMHSHQLQAN